jgi:hypothetical protein
MFGLFNQLYDSIVPRRTFVYKDEIPKRVYDSIDWSNTSVAGSYALQKFTGDMSWEPHDVDLMVACSSKEEFIEESDKFQQLVGAKLINQAWFD